MANSHDSGYKLLFSHPEMVHALLEDFMPGEWLAEANFTSLERVNASYVSENERQRHDDMVWRLKIGQKWVWVYLLLEFQSEPDPWMALRMWVYVGLLAQHLVREGETQDGRLPALVPIVLYRGEATWKAATNVADCFAPSLPGLEPFRPHLLYHLIDQARLKLHPKQEVRNLAEATFRLEASRTPEDIVRLIKSVDAILQGDGAGPIRQTFNVWLRTLLRRKAERLFDEGIDEGLLLRQQRALQVGLDEGRHEGLAKAVSLQLKLRFGDAPEYVHALLSSASEEQLTHWLGMILTASSLEDLFGPGIPKH